MWIFFHPIPNEYPLHITICKKHILFAAKPITHKYFGDLRVYYLDAPRLPPNPTATWRGDRNRLFHYRTAIFDSPHHDDGSCATSPPFLPLPRFPTTYIGSIVQLFVLQTKTTHWNLTYITAQYNHSERISLPPFPLTIVIPIDRQRKKE